MAYTPPHFTNLPLVRVDARVLLSQPLWWLPTALVRIHEKMKNVTPIVSTLMSTTMPSPSLSPVMMLSSGDGTCNIVFNDQQIEVSWVRVIEETEYGRYEEIESRLLSVLDAADAEMPVHAANMTYTVRLGDSDIAPQDYILPEAACLPLDTRVHNFSLSFAVSERSDHDIQVQNTPFGVLLVRSTGVRCDQSGVPDALKEAREHLGSSFPDCLTPHALQEWGYEPNRNDDVDAPSLA